MDEISNFEGVVEESSEIQERQRKEVRLEYRRLLNETKENEEILKLEPDHLGNYLLHADALFEKVKRTREAALDAKFLSVCASISKQKAEALITNLISFQPSEFADKVKTFLGRLTEKDDDNVHDGQNQYNLFIPKHKWVMFGKTVSVVFRKAPAFHLMFGCFESGPLECKKRSHNVHRDDKDAASTNLVMPQRVTGMGYSYQETTTEEVERLFALLQRLYNRNDRQPVCYFQFVVNPQSFNQTVENIFHVSFLIKDGVAELSLNEDQLPVIAPVKERSDENPVFEKSNQFVMSITMENWREIIKVFNITRTIIPPRKNYFTKGEK
ncbi:non-structural maintenance of chromosomes element 4 homolog A-like isoform X2 [Tachypleus tridentatus]|uniref:non-structural maintenance of chromosomes element 4 homolog A-like isoform X2 n=1 Tax=Tachypleus tridentatus TaxID=6853 RepID=UPI003FD58931